MDLVTGLNSARVDNFRKDAERRDAIRAARAFLTRVETLFDHITYFTCQIPALVASLKVCYDVGLFKKWNLAGGGGRSH